MNFDVRDKVALVTGANRGIGEAITTGLLRQGAHKVYAAVRRTESVDHLLESWGDAIAPLELDLTDPPSIFRAAETAGDVELVINNAGVLRTSPVLAEDAVESLQLELQTNVFGLLFMGQAFAPVLAGNGGGAFVQLNSIASLRANPDFSTYCASKAAAYSLTQSLRVALHRQGTLVLSVHPGPIATKMGDAAGLTAIAEPPELVSDAILKSLAAGDFHCFPDSMAKKVGFLYDGFARRVVEYELPPP